MLMSREPRINRNSLEISIARVSNPKVGIFFAAGQSPSFNPVRMRDPLFGPRNEMRIGTRRQGDDDDDDEDDVGNADAEDVPRREAERYNHKPVIDLLVLKSQALEQRVPAGYPGGALKFSGLSMHELLTLCSHESVYGVSGRFSSN